MTLTPARVWRRAEKERTMKKATSKRRNAGLLDECDFSKGVRGKYAKRYAEGTNVVLLDPDVARIFPDSKSVNEALRALAKVIHDRVARGT